MHLPLPRSEEMKRLYRPYRDDWWWMDATDFWMTFFLVLGFFIYLAWRYT